MFENVQNTFKMFKGPIYGLNLLFSIILIEVAIERISPMNEIFFDFKNIDVN